jgi:hypothetical protein
MGLVRPLCRQTTSMGDMTTSPGNNYKTVCILLHTAVTTFFDTNRLYFIFFHDV